MKKLDFQPSKSQSSFRRNYKLHDAASEAGFNLLTQWGMKFTPYGEDNRYSKEWEAGEDKPDVIVETHAGKAFIDWKAKTGKRFLANKRAVEAYEKWSHKMNAPVIIAFFVFDKGNKKLLERRCAVLGIDKYIVNEKKEWDKNSTVEFNENLPIFDKSNTIKAIKTWYGYQNDKRTN